MNTKYIISRAYSTNDWSNIASCVIQIDADLAKKLLDRMSTLDRLIERGDRDIMSLEAWSYAATWHSKSIDELDDEQFIVTKDEPNIDIVEAGCDTVVVYKDDVAWKAYPKYEDTEVSSAVIDRRIIEEIACQGSSTANRQSREYVDVTTMKCNCDGWKTNKSLITDVFVLAHEYSIDYEGEEFEYCPWCGDMLVPDWVDLSRVTNIRAPKGQTVTITVHVA